MPGSTSTPAPVSTHTTSEKLQLRRVTEGLSGQQTYVPMTVKFASGAPWTAKPTDWIITIGTDVVDVCADKDFAAKYEIVRPGLLLPVGDCRVIEETTGIGTTRNVQELLKAIERLARVAIGDVQIPFTPGQLEEIKHRALKRGLSLKQEIQRIVDRIKDEIFYKS